MLRWLVLILAIAFAAVLTAYAIGSLLFSTHPLPSWEEAFELKRALTSGRATLPLSVAVEARGMVINITVDGVQYRIPAARVRVLFRSRAAAVYEEEVRGMWRVWGNGTHAGVVSYLDIVEEGYVVRVVYVTAEPGVYASLCVFDGRRLPAAVLFSKLKGAIQMDSAEYSWTGARKIIIEEKRLDKC